CRKRQPAFTAIEGGCNAASSWIISGVDLFKGYHFDEFRIHFNAAIIHCALISLFVSPKTESSFK
ncbi:MAG: hypothetical protein ACPGVO_03295, partial [Spirulinaceae cyanobacterium]